MSAVYFTAKNKEATLYGSERAYAGLTCTRLFEHSLDMSLPNNADWREMLRPILGPDTYARTREDAIRSLSSLMTHHVEYVMGEQEASLFGTTLNTTLAMGSDAVKLLARVHGQCELHGWVAEDNAPWLSDIIAEGLDTGVLRPAKGWDKVEELLRDPGSDVVMSYSVTDSFPSVYFLSEDDDEEMDEMEDLYEPPHDELWSRCLAKLKSEEFESWQLELSPDTWGTFKYRGPTGFGLSKWLVEQTEVKA